MPEIEEKNTVEQPFSFYEKEVIDRVISIGQKKITDAFEFACEADSCSDENEVSQLITERFKEEFFPSDPRLRKFDKFITGCYLAAKYAEKTEEMLLETRISGVLAESQILENFSLSPEEIKNATDFPISYHRDSDGKPWTVGRIVEWFGDDWQVEFDLLINQIKEKVKEISSGDQSLVILDELSPDLFSDFPDQWTCSVAHGSIGIWQVIETAFNFAEANNYPNQEGRYLQLDSTSDSFSKSPNESQWNKIREDSKKASEMLSGLGIFKVDDSTLDKIKSYKELAET